MRARHRSRARGLTATGHVRARRAVRRRPDPEPQRGLPEGPAAATRSTSRSASTSTTPAASRCSTRCAAPSSRWSRATRPSPTCRSRARPTSAPRCRRCCSAPATRRSPPAASRRSSRSARAAASRSAPTSSPAGCPAARSGSATRAGTTTARCSKAPASRCTTYPYYDARDRRRSPSTRCARRCAGLPAKSVVLLHACCHNPTGVDLTPAQWDALIPLLAERELLPYLDLAYQGFGDGIAEDAYAVRALAAARGSDGRPMRFVVANSFSKSMSLYGERCGALSVVCADAARGRATCSASSSSRCAATTRARRSTAARSSPPCSASRRCARAWEAELGGDARAHPGDAPGAARRPRGEDAGPRLRLLPQPARHVQLHRPDRRAGRPAARGVRGLPGALGPDLRRRPEHAATSRRPALAMAAVLDG